MERVRAMLYESKLHQELWAEAIVTANYIRNRSPVKNKDKTPWELFFGKPPDVSMMRTFGARAYALIPKEQRSKLDQVSRKGIFVGYEPGSKAYRVRLDDSRKIIISRDVTFDEDYPSSSASTAVPDIQGESDGQDSSTDDEDDSDDAAGNAPAAGQPQQQRPPGGEAASSRQQVQDMEQDDSDSEGASAIRQSKRANMGKNLNPEWYKANVATSVDDYEPQTYEEAIKSSNADKWRQAMEEEMASLHGNNTWTLEQVPTGVKPIPVKWVCRSKHVASGNIENYSRGRVHGKSSSSEGGTLTAQVPL
jgi:hypothetical protein